ncbi:hypothetical protein SLA2020_214370 [Shorea laevis]
MAVRVQNLPKKNLNQISVHSQPHLSISCPMWWNSNEDRIAQSLSNISLKIESPPQSSHVAKYLGSQLSAQESSTVHVIDQSHHEVGVMGGSNSQCNSSESGEDEYGARGTEVLKPVFMLSNSDPMFNPSHISNNNSMAFARYPNADAYFGGLYAPYGQQVLTQMGPQMLGTQPTRIPLPLDLSEDGPIYVNAKQYHGILRRRQSRAKLEAQNKLVKTRKPYLHESRHRHAVNRVRGSGGRFLRTKNLQQPDEKNETSEFISHCSGTVDYVGPRANCSDTTSTSNNDVIFHQPAQMSLGISPLAVANMQSGEKIMCNGTQHYASVVR